MYRLLLADDEQLERRVLSETLKKSLGDICEIYEARNGREAVSQAFEKDIQIAILDIEMPGINGLDAAEQIMNRRPETCIIFLTAFDDFKYTKRAIHVRAMDYILKPWDKNEIISVIESAMHMADRNNEISPEASRGERADDSRLWDELDGDKLGTVMNKAREYLSQNYMKEISMHDAAEALNYSDAYFSKLFKQIFNKNFTAYLTEYRIEIAKKELKESGMSIKEIGENVGYFDSNYFAKVFKRYVGMSPSDYRLHI